MPEKMWGSEPFWGLGYDWDPEWVLTDRQRELRDTLIQLCETEMRANAKRSDDELLYPRRNLELLGEHGFLGLTVPEEYGGLGENHVAYTMVCETIARYGCASTAMCYVMHIGAVNTIMLRPTDALIDRYIRPLRTGKIGTLSYSDPETGSHFWYPVSSGAERVNGGFRVRKKASWTTSGGFADFYVVQTTSPDFKGYDDLSVFVIDKDDVKAQPSLWDALGLRGNQSGPIEIEWAEIPEDRTGRPGRRRRGLQRRVGRPVVPDRLVLGVERDRDGRHRHRQAPHDAQAPRGRRPARGRLPDDPGLRRRGRDGHERQPAVRGVGRAGDGQGHRRQHADARARRDGPGRLPALGLADQVRGGEERGARRGQDAPRLRRVGLQARHGARAVPARRQGRLGDGPDQRGAAAVRRQGHAAGLRGAGLLEPALQPPRGGERGRRSSTARASASWPSS